MREFLEPGQVVVICPSSCGGALVFKQATGSGNVAKNLTIAETSTLPYAVRILKPGIIRIFNKLPGGIYSAALPAKDGEKVLNILREALPGMQPAKNVMQTSLQNGNYVIHPAVTLLNAALIERTGGDFFFYEHGVTPAVGRLMKAVDNERIALGCALGVDVYPDPDVGMDQGYMYNNTCDEGYVKAPGFKEIKAQSSLDYRYFNEDVGFGMIFIQSLGRQINVPTPLTDSMVKIISVVMEKDYAAMKQRTLSNLGLGGLDSRGIIKAIE